MDYDHFNKRPQLILSFDRPTLVYKTCVEEILKPSTDDPFAASEKPQATAEIIKRVLYEEKREREDGTTFTYRKIDKYSYLVDNWEDFDSKNAYPIMNSKLAAYLGYDDATEEEVETENSQYANFSTPNRYKKYYDKIQYFYKTYLDNDNFRTIISISKDGFAWANKLQIGHTKFESKQLMFGKNKVDVNPQMGVNNGPYEKARGTNIQIIGIFIKDDVIPARKLLKYFRDGYSDHYFDGLKKYTGKDFTFAPPELHLQIENKKNPIPEIEHFLYDADQNQKLNSDVTYLALYLTPISKNAANKEDRKIYYQVKELLLKYKIVSQSIETAKMLIVLADDEKNKRKNFAFTLQNMAIAMNAKLGGTPWRINVRKQDELIIGIGAFKNIDTNTQYIGSAFSFDNTGAFTSFQYFQKDELKELAGNGPNTITLKAPDALENDLNLIFPSVNGTDGQVLSTNGSGNLTWVTPSPSGWNLTGNSGTNPGTNFIGTTDDKDLVFKINNEESERINLANSNTSFGYKSLFSNPTGPQNTANGCQALYSNTSGNSNTAMGSNALYDNTQGYENTAIGARALENNTTGNFNTANGVQALYYSTTGGYNTANGYNAGRYISDGSTAIQTCNNSVYLGAQTKASANPTTNEIVIGYNATGAGSNTATLGNTAIVTTVLRGTVRFADGATPFTSYVGIKAPNGPTSYTMILPGAQGSANTYLKNDGAGNLSWASTGSSGWNLTGNSGTTPGTNFIGTTDENDLVFKINNQEAGRINLANSNTSLGYQSLYSNTTGSKNTANGYQTLYLNTSGSYNTAFGYYALKTNTTGQENTAFGSQALHLSVANSRSTAIGHQAMLYADARTTGRETFNTAVGYQALRGSSAPLDNTGRWNTAIGDQALWSNTSGEINTAIGCNTLYSNTTGFGNLALGNDALNENTTGVGNTAVGNNTLIHNTVGGYNTAIGTNALFENTTGNYNTALGVSSGRYITGGSTANKTSTYSTYIGQETKASVDGNTNEIVIGYNATGAGSNTATLGNTAIVTTVLRGNVTIGTCLTLIPQASAPSSPTPGMIYYNSGDKKAHCWDGTAWNALW